MKNILFPKNSNEILDSIHDYQKLLMSDINLSIRLSYNNQTYSTRLVEWDDTTVIFESPMHGTNDIILPSNMSLDIIIVSKISLFRTTFTIHKNYREKNNLFYVAEITSPIIKNQQRENFRLDVILDVHYDLTHTTSDTPLHSGDGTSVNISVGGMCLVAGEQFHKNDLLSLSFSLMDTPLNLVGEVLFLGEKNELGSYVHRLRFQGLDAAETNQLNRLIFLKQRQLIRRV